MLPTVHAFKGRVAFCRRGHAGAPHARSTVCVQAAATLSRLGWRSFHDDSMLLLYVSNRSQTWVCRYLARLLRRCRSSCRCAAARRPSKPGCCRTAKRLRRRCWSATTTRRSVHCINSVEIHFVFKFEKQQQDSSCRQLLPLAGRCSACIPLNSFCIQIRKGQQVVVSYYHSQVGSVHALSCI